MLLWQGVWLQAEPYAVYDQQTLTLDNGVVKRVVRLNAENGGITSDSLKLAGARGDYLIPGSEEFYFEIDGRPCTGLDRWKTVSVESVTGDNKGNGALVVLEHADPDLRISITYMLYPGLPIIRKKVAFLNSGQKDLKLEALEVEYLRFLHSERGTDCWVMHDYARQKSLGQFIGGAYDPVVVVHQVNRRRGMVLGNEAPGVMKRTTAFLSPNLVTAGLTYPDQTFGFRKWLEPGGTWESPWVFTGIYADTDDPSVVLNGPVNDFVRKHLGTRLSLIPEKPVFVYNTWMPFKQQIDEKLIIELAAAAAECGIEEFVIDDGWQNSYGDWGVDARKFPRGLKPVFDHIKSKGMKPGLWISIASARAGSNVFAQHPDWMVRKADGSPVYLHKDQDTDAETGTATYSMCLTTGWFDHIKGVITGLIEENGLQYLKADLAVVTGAYTTDKTRSGCHAPNHPMHRDRNESLLEMYRRTWQLFDELHDKTPNLFIDCTFETMGALHLVDLDMCKHAEGNWLSNFRDSAPLGSFRVRQLSWWRTPVIPAAALVIGNQEFGDPDLELSLQSLIGSLPIVLGDPRALTTGQRARMKSWADWLRGVQDRHDFMSYRQDLSGFGEPAEGRWDGYQRINSDSHSGGVVGIFRQNARAALNRVTVGFLDPASHYEVCRAPGGERVSTSTGQELADKGFPVNLEKPYDGAVFEIRRIP